MERKKMKTGRSTDDLVREIMRQAETKRDYIADTRHVELVPEGDKVKMIIDNKVRLDVKPLAHRQIGEHTKLPAVYADHMLDKAKDLYCTNVNYWFNKYPAVQMVRTLDGADRAFLSNRFRALDNLDLAEAVLPPLNDRGVNLMSGEVTDTKLYLKFVDKRIERDLKPGQILGRGHDHFETCSPALTVSNSEVGKGSLSVQASVWFGGCTNLVVLNEKSVRKYHVGSRHDIGEEVFALLSDTTRKLNDAALWATLRDVVGAAFDEAAFEATVAKLQDAKNDVIDLDPVATIEVVSKKYGFGENERGSILKHYCQTGDFSRFGIQAAITRTAEDLPDYDRASDFEIMGGKVIELQRNEWKSMVKAVEDMKEAA
jgi:hypothetical protein